MQLALADAALADVLLLGDDDAVARVDGFAGVHADVGAGLVPEVGLLLQRSVVAVGNSSSTSSPFTTPCSSVGSSAITAPPVRSTATRPGVGSNPPISQRCDGCAQVSRISPPCAVRAQMMTRSMTTIVNDQIGCAGMKKKLVRALMAATTTPTARARRLP